MFLMYKTIIKFRIQRGDLTQDFVAKTKSQLDYYLDKNQISKNDYDSLVELMDMKGQDNE